ncbi:inorganic diphosphatase [Roseivirga sp.]|uniref:inorganic diphosphatase n=1 Tax=Roseivirga sp. TaxID=1964215 RepID=UPI003B8D13F2
MSQARIFLKRNIFVLLAVLFVSCTTDKSQVDDLHVNYLADFAPISSEGHVNVVIEIPAGTVEKWEVSKPSGTMIQDEENGKPRVINYLGYPANYGMVPQTLLPKAVGGDGDPLDVLVLGEPIERGKVVETKIIGGLKLLDNGETDDKLIGIQIGSLLSHINSIGELEKEYGGMLEIVNIWFSNYKGKGKLESSGFYGAEESRIILEQSISAYKKQ